MLNKLLLFFCFLTLLSILVLFFKKQSVYAFPNSIPNDFYAIKMDNIDKKPIHLKDFKGKPILFVNVASRCGFTPQYKGLEELHDTFKDKGLIIIGVPSNDFGGQEPGTEETIKTFCRTKYDVSFLMTEKMSTRGKNQSDLFAFLTQSNPKLTGPVTWNFNKFLVSPDGKLINRFGSNTRPMSEKIISSIKPYILN